MRTFDRLARNFSGRKVLAVLSVIVVVHLVVMSFYINDNRRARRMANRDAVIQKLVNVVHLLEATPVAERPKAIDAMNDPYLKASITTQPKYKLQFRVISFWEISQALRKQLDSFNLSIELTKAQWLNVKASIYTQFLLTQLLFVSIEIAILGTILISAWSINRFTRPIEKFKRAAERLSFDLNTEPVTIDGPSVVQEAAQAMNKMQDRIRELIRDRTQMLAAISHDLRTPITRMKLRAQFVENSTEKNELTADLDEMESMINETLSFAREDSTNETKANLDLVSLLSSICTNSSDMGQSVRFECKRRRVAVIARPVALKRALTNLVNNANRYANNVVVSLQIRYHSVIIKVEDDGPGIAEKELEQVFEPFYRGEHSRSRDTGGTGLGLAVTRDIIRDHNGKIYLRNRLKGGLCATVELPLKI